jgi:F420-non-reducing hydrogenase iron-sulfur subunit
MAQTNASVDTKEEKKVKPKDPQDVKIVAYLCNWCSYAGSDAAGTARLRQPENLRIIRVPCSGRINALFVLKAFAAWVPTVCLYLGVTRMTAITATAIFMREED